MKDNWGYEIEDSITEIWRDRINHETGEYIKDNEMWSPREYDEWQSYQHDLGKQMQDESTYLD